MGLTQSRLAARCNVNARWLMNAEAGARSMGARDDSGLTAAERVARELGVEDVDVLWQPVLLPNHVQRATRRARLEAHEPAASPDRGGITRERARAIVRAAVTA
jgi:transcriptional regulator with XRE-family HTH domain